MNQQEKHNLNGIKTGIFTMVSIGFDRYDKEKPKKGPSSLAGACKDAEKREMSQPSGEAAASEADCVRKTRAPVTL